MNNEYKILIGALRRSVTGRQMDLPEKIDWNILLWLAGVHRVEALLYDGLKKTPDIWALVPEEIKQYLNGTYMRAVYLDVQFDYIRKQLAQRLTQAEVKHIFLKGSVLRQDYPDPVLRSMSDIDVLVQTNDFGTIAEIMDSLSAKHVHSDGNHRTYTFSSGVIVEYHPNLLHQETPIGIGINPGWQYSKPNQNELTEEGIYLNTICHLANHFGSTAICASPDLTAILWSRNWRDLACCALQSKLRICPTGGSEMGKKRPCLLNLGITSSPAAATE